ncbi:TIGR01777 family oxidoreductase [Staphylococcus americanisciuri]|uniref:TIGR01777 family oxidoreductase n=1 Tax=Staphylococcus americanisciuri TaxID=2973940 RepID=A0ABT2F383_9STAP|nr:TIGR01777 family oxidoreductase [Staphylococcus americanisciuri]MCS4486877.1 TIGR01777 family oxidoreductase [Staphylococcus americanisciuri]
MTTYLISGGTGLVGQRLLQRLTQSQTNTVYILTRSSQQSHQRQITYIDWSQENWEQHVPDNIDIVINLAGTTLNHYWTSAHKQRMMTSRIQATRALYDLFRQRSKSPDVLFNASAIGYYPPSQSTIYTEETQRLPHDLLSEIVYQWEQQAALFNNLGTRVLYGRFGLIFSKHGGALPMMALPYHLFVGGKLSSGHQPYSWIHIDDLVSAILYLIAQPSANGPYNFTAPNPTTQHQFGRVLGRILHRPHYTRVPGGLLRLLLGQMATLILDTQYVLPERLLQQGFTFQYPNLDEALKEIYTH